MTLENVEVGMRVVRGRNWRSGKHKWKDDVMRDEKGSRCGGGAVIGFKNESGVIYGEMTTRDFYDEFNSETGPGWAAVMWDSGSASIYRIGARGPLGRWWTGSYDPQVKFGNPCFSLQVE